MAVNTYIDPLTYTRYPTGLEDSSLVGNVGYLGNAGVAQGATSLPLLVGLAVGQSASDRITIFDGVNTETVFVTASANAGATSVSVTALAFAHSGGTSGAVYCSDGTSGSLSDCIVRASRRLENKCQQALLYAAYSDTIPLRSMQAVISKENKLYIRPRNYPVKTVTALSIESVAGAAITMDPSQAIIDTLEQSVYIPVLQASGVQSANSTWVLNTLFDMATPGVVIIGYTAGYAYSALPPDVQLACILYTSAELARRQNPIGASESRMGKRQVRFRLMGDEWGANALTKEADSILENGNYVRGAW